LPDIFDEVEADLRAERTQRFLMRYAGVFVALAVLVVAGVGGWQAWQSYAHRRAALVSDDYQAAQKLADATAADKAGDRAAALAALDKVAAAGAPGYRALALLREAALKADGGDLAGASALWDQVAGDGGTPPTLRDFATLIWAMRHVDTGEPAQVQARLQPLLAPDSAWKALASETEALLQIRQGQTDGARTTLRQLAHDVTAPAGVRGRANGLLQQLGG
jgi:hypothetical protein